MSGEEGLPQLNSRNGVLRKEMLTKKNKIRNNRQSKIRKDDIRVKSNYLIYQLYYLSQCDLENGTKNLIL